MAPFRAGQLLRGANVERQPGQTNRVDDDFPSDHRQGGRQRATVPAVLGEPADRERCDGKGEEIAGVGPMIVGTPSRVSVQAVLPSVKTGRPASPSAKYTTIAAAPRRLAEQCADQEHAERLAGDRHRVNGVAR